MQKARREEDQGPADQKETVDDTLEAVVKQRAQKKPSVRSLFCHFLSCFI